MQTNSPEVIPIRQSLEPMTMPDPFLAESPLYFSVSARAVSVADVGGEPQLAVAFQAIVRDDNGEVLGMHGRKYKLVPNEPLYAVLTRRLGALVSI